MNFAIVGNSGSGKSTLAQAIAHQTGSPVLDLDTVAWEPQQIAVARAEDQIHKDVEAFCGAHPDWVVEGCYAGPIAVALSRSPMLLFMDLGMEKCLENCRRRAWEPHKYRSKTEQTARLGFLLNWVRDYYTRDGPLSLREHEELFVRYRGPKRRLKQPILPVADVLASLTGGL